MAEKAKHAFGTLEGIDAALTAGKIDSYDILFVKDANGKPYVGWIDKDGQKVICDHETDLSEVESDISDLEAAIATKVEAEEVDKKINTAVTDSVASANAYTDGKIEAAINEHMVKKYEITSAPEGTLVDYRESEIRIMCPVNSVWTKQDVGVGGDANCYYATFKTYVFDDNVTGYIEHLGTQVDSEVLTEFSTDEYGRRYQVTWLALARYDETTKTWSYYGKNSTTNKYIGWDYQIDWYNADGIMIASDCIRINLSNESCHSSIEPYYVGTMKNEVEIMVDKKIAEVSAYEIIEF